MKNIIIKLASALLVCLFITSCAPTCKYGCPAKITDIEHLKTTPKNFDTIIIIEKRDAE